MTCGFGLCPVLHGVGFSLVRVLAHLLLSGSVRSLAKPGFWFDSFLLGLGYFPSLLKDKRQKLKVYNYV